MDETDWVLVRERMQAMLGAATRIGSKTFSLRVDPPASLDEILRVEERLSFPLPAALREFFLNFSSRVECVWFLPDDLQLPDEFRELFCGNCWLALEWMAEFEKERQGWVETCFPNPGDPYDAVWHDKLVFMSVGNGDYFAINIAPGAQPAVVYLSHDDGEGHGRYLGADFQDFLLRWSRLGCVG